MRRLPPGRCSGFSRARCRTKHHSIPRETKRQPRRVKLSWSRPRADYFPVTSYAVYYSSTGKRWKPLTQVVGRRVAFKVNSKRRYWFMVTANNLAGESRPSRVFVPR